MTGQILPGDDELGVIFPVMPSLALDFVGDGMGEGMLEWHPWVVSATPGKCYWLPRTFWLFH